MSKITKKQLHNGWHCHDTEIIKMKKELRELKQSVLRLEKLTDEKLLDEPQLKQLSQSIFDGLDEKWRFAAVDADGSANGFDVHVYPRGDDKYGLFAYADDYANSDDNSIQLGEGYDASNWQNSLIERDIAKELLEIDLSIELTGSDLCRAMLARGDKWVVCRLADTSDEDALNNGRPILVTKFNGDFYHKEADQYWKYAIPINSQGEPLTASEVGL